MTDISDCSTVSEQTPLSFAQPSTRPDTQPDIRAVFFDIDGTLTSFETHRVPDSTVDAIHRLQDKDIKVLICTGRSPSQMTVVLDTMPVHFDGIVAFNGQYCVDDHGFFEAQALDPDDIAVILDWLDAHPDVVCNFGEKDYVYFNHTNEQLQATWNQLGKTAPTRYFDDPRARALTHETFQISPFVDEAAEAELVGLCRNVAGVRWHPDFTDLIPADGGKPRGIQRFMKRFGITREQTMAFGDGGNDTDMLAFAGIGVAMGNASDAPKAAADYVTDSVDDNGVLNALTHFGVL
ncbi:Cof-type HAD-IIB family hydrolase [Bifidobacterium oedipodis]|nr:Cof-type HAD-IIB family hydrolase [Bifidobacterium sp. DSM 109957]